VVKPGFRGWCDPTSAGFSRSVRRMVAVLDRSVHLGYAWPNRSFRGCTWGSRKASPGPCGTRPACRTHQSLGRSRDDLDLGLGTVGAVAGGVVGSVYGTTPGRASLMASAAMWADWWRAPFMGGMTGSDDTALLSRPLPSMPERCSGRCWCRGFALHRPRALHRSGGLSGGLLLGGLYLAVQDKQSTAKGALTATAWAWQRD